MSLGVGRGLKPEKWAGSSQGETICEHAQAVLAIGDEGKSAGGHHADFDVVHVVELAVGGENLIEFGGVGFFDIDDGEALFACRDVGIGASDVNIARVGRAALARWRRASVARDR